MLEPVPALQTDLPALFPKKGLLDVLLWLATPESLDEPIDKTFLSVEADTIFMSSPLNKVFLETRFENTMTKRTTNNSGDDSSSRYAKVKNVFSDCPDNLRLQVAKIALAPDVPQSTKVLFLMLQGLDGICHLEQWCPHHCFNSLKLVLQPSMLFKDSPFFQVSSNVSNFFDRSSTEDTLNQIVSPVARGVI